MSKILAALLYVIVLVFLMISGIHPEDRFTWFLEVSWVILGVLILLVFNFRGISITWILACGLFVHALILIYGGWYTYEKVPLGFWMQETFGFERNHYDRIGHLAQGFIPALLYREVLIRFKVVKNRYWREFVIFGFVMAFTALFELLEFGAALALGQGADAFLGSQGDVWDAQWDMLMCGIGGLLSIIIFSRWHERRLKNIEYRMSNFQG